MTSDIDKPDNNNINNKDFNNNKAPINKALNKSPINKVLPIVHDTPLDTNSKALSIKDLNNNIESLSKELSVNDRAFCYEYAKLGNSVQAYINTHKTNNRGTAGTNGFHLLQKDKVKQLIGMLDRKARETTTKDEFTKLKDYLSGLMEDIKLKRTTVGVRAAELLIKLYGFGRETIRIEDDKEANDLLKQIYNAKKGNT